MAAVAPALFAQMRARGAKPGELVALLAAAGAMSETVPPSLVLITIGTVTSVSISALFTGGLLPGAILLIIVTATAMSWALTRSGFSHQLAGMMAHLPGGKAGFLAVSIVAFVVLGSVLEGIPAIVLFGPLLFPTARQLGIHEVLYAIVAVLAMGIGLFAPPFGVMYYTACAIGRVPPHAGIRPMAGHGAALLAGLAIIAAIPWFSIGFLSRRHVQHLPRLGGGRNLSVHVARHAGNAMDDIRIGRAAKFRILVIAQPRCDMPAEGYRGGGHRKDIGVFGAHAPLQPIA
jgi:TRAP-type C4-dicarboxylate transport system permease large subunit